MTEDVAHDAKPAARASGCGRGAIVLLGLFIAAATLTIYWVSWTADQFALVTGDGRPIPSRLLTPLMHALVTGVPAWLLARRTPSTTWQRDLRSWQLAALFVLLMAPLYFLELSAAQSAALLQTVLACAFTLFLVWRRTPRFGLATGPYWPMFAAVPLIVWPWVLWGALGSWLDTLLNLAAAFALGLAIVAVLLPAWRASLDGRVPGRSQVLYQGFVAGIVMLIMGAGFGFNAQQLILLMLLPALGWLLVGITWASRDSNNAQGWLAAVLLIALVAAAPLLFIDADELLLVLNLGSRDIGAYAIRAEAWSIAICLVLGALAVALGRKPSAWGTAWPGRIAAALLSAGLLLVYAGFGQSGLQGEQLFVILSEQADLSTVATIDDPLERRMAAYEALIATGERTQQDLRRTLDRLGIDYTPYYLVNALEVDAGPFVRLWLSTRPEVDRILDSPYLRALPEPAPVTTGELESASNSWNLAAVRADEVWDAFAVRGEGMLIGQADSGVEYKHSELAGAYRGNANGQYEHDYNWFDPWYGTEAPVDSGGHGTHTLGTIVGQTVGVAPGAEWIGCANLPRNLGNPADYLACMQFLFAPFPQDGDAWADGRPELGAHIFNNSWGCPSIEGCDADSLLPAVRALRVAGIFMAASAGNEGEACATVDSPIALYDDVFSVGAVDSRGELAPFSSRGPVEADGSGRVKPDIVAPGVDVLSSMLGNTFGLSSGTSMAGPHVAGVVALMWSANPALIGDVERTEEILRQTARPYDYETFGVPSCGDLSQLPDNAVGFGHLDAYGAVEMALAGE